MDKGGKLTIFSYRFGGKKVVKMFKELLDTGKVHINLVLNNTMSKKSIASLLELLDHPNANDFLQVIVTRLSQVLEFPIHHFKIYYFKINNDTNQMIFGSANCTDSGLFGGNMEVYHFFKPNQIDCMEQWMRKQWEIFNNSNFICTRHWLVTYLAIYNDINVEDIENFNDEDNEDNILNYEDMYFPNITRNFQENVEACLQQNIFLFNQRQEKDTQPLINNNPEAVVDIISNATTSILMIMFSISNEDIINILINKHNNDEIDILVITSAIGTRPWIIDRLRNNNIPVIVINQVFMHIKMIVIDYDEFLSGCANASLQAFKCNYGEFLVYFPTNDASNQTANDINISMSLVSATLYFTLCMIAYYYPYPECDFELKNFYIYTPE